MSMSEMKKLHVPTLRARIDVTYRFPLMLSYVILVSHDVLNLLSKNAHSNLGHPVFKNEVN